VAARPDRLQVVSVVDRAYSALRERILSGELPHHAKLRQEDLAAELGVSRTPVREALGRLAADGLVELLPNRGARVADITTEDMRGSYEARLVIEPAAAALAAERRDAAAMAAMRRAIAAHRSGAGGVRGAFAANRDFHLALVTASGNPFLLRFVEHLWARRLGLRIYEAQRGSVDLIAMDADQHEAIADAVERGDAAGAERLTREHIGGAMGLLLQELAGDDAGDRR
jgi:DNA-binding GntR family transcriptional regulator